MLRLLIKVPVPRNSASIIAAYRCTYTTKAQADVAPASTQQTKEAKPATTQCGSTRASKPSSIGGSAPLGKFDEELRQLDPAVLAQKVKKHPYAEEEPLQPHPGGRNPKTGEIGGPKGPEPTRFGDWERKGRCVDF